MVHMKKNMTVILLTLFAALYSSLADELKIADFDRGGKPRLAVATGSRRIDEVLFELSKGYGYPSEGGVCVLFYPNEKKMLPFRHLRDGIKFLKSEL